MSRLLALFAVGCLALTAMAQAPPAPTLGVARGEVVKVGKDMLTVRPRGEGGKFEKELRLRVTGTTTVTQVSVQMRGGKPVPVQQATSAKELQPKQAIAMIYTAGPTGPVLLSAVVLGAPK
jgi:hypothetical protein